MTGDLRMDQKKIVGLADPTGDGQATNNPGGAPSRLGQVNSPVHGLSAGGLLGAQLSKVGGR